MDICILKSEISQKGKHLIKMFTCGKDYEDACAALTHTQTPSDASDTQAQAI